MVVNPENLPESPVIKGPSSMRATAPYCVVTSKKTVQLNWYPVAGGRTGRITKRVATIAGMPNGTQCFRADRSKLAVGVIKLVANTFNDDHFQSASKLKTIRILAPVCKTKTVNGKKKKVCK